VKRLTSEILTAVAVLCGVLSSSALAQPTITLLNPSSRTSGATGNFTLNLTGTNFCNRALVSFNGTSRPLSGGGTATDVSTTISGTEIGAPGTVPVTITNPTGCAVVGTSSPATTFTINPALTFTPASLPGGSVSSPYVQSLNASGGTPPYSTPTLQTGTLPPGTTFGAGSVSFNFTPSGAITYAFTLLMTDAGGGSISPTYTIVIRQPSTASATAGTPQSATVTTTFATNMQVRVFDALGLPVQGTQVTFPPPGTGPSGTFSGSNVVLTDASGFATAPAFTANTIAGSYLLTTSVLGTSGTPSFSLSNLPGSPASIAVASANPQSAPAGTTFVAPLQALVRDAFNNPVGAGISVTFTQTPPAGTGPGVASFSPAATVTTNASGVAVVTATANTKAGGPYTVNASTPGVGGVAAFSLTNLPGNPNFSTATAGTPQSAAISTAFPVALKALITDSFGNPTPGIAVTFTPPLPTPNAPNGTFASSPTVNTDAAGIATAPAFTANTFIGGPYTVTAGFSGQGTPLASFSLTNTAGVPASITATAGSGQSVTVGNAFPTALQATVRDASSNPVPNVAVTFTAPGSGASGTFSGSATVNTDASGVATAPTFTANTTAGSYNVTASTAGVGTPASFSLTNNPGPPSSISATAGTPQSATIGAAFATALKATVRDASSNPVPNVTVTFAAPGSGASGASGTFSGSTAVLTDSAGVATAPTFTANTTAGSYSVTASTVQVATPASFSLTNNAGAPATITVLGGSGQSVTIGNAFPTALQATVRDASSNPVPNVSVTFTAPGSGASGTFSGSATVQTGATGVATAPTFTANTIAGSYNVSASTAGVGTPASFSLTNNAGPPASITTTAGTPQSTTIGTAFPAAMQATVRDASSNPVPNVAVSFVAPGSGASGTFPLAEGLPSTTAFTNASGVATASTFVANNISGSYTVAASTSGVATPANFSLTNNAGPPATITTTAGSGQSVAINTAFPTALKATVQDASSNPVPNVSVVFAAPGSGASGTFSGSATVLTDTSGVATAPTFTANLAAGSYSVTATAAGVGKPASFTLTNNPGAPTTITATAGAGQSVTINTAFPTALKATVKDAGGNLVPNASVVFAAPGAGAGGTFASPATVLTDSSGVATAPTFTANSTAGSYAVTATAGAAGPANFGLTNNPGAPVSIAATGGINQSTTIGFAFQSPLQATVRDVGGNLVPNALVTFSLPASGASASFNGIATNLPTNSSGVATSPSLTANGIEGGYSASATVPGAAAPATFPLSNTSGVSITTSSLPVGTVGQSYGAGIGAAGGKPPYTFSIASGGLPAGLTFTGGSISGTPLVAGITGVQVQVTDSAGSSASKTLSLRILPALTITTSSTLPTGFVGQAYSVSFQATGGDTPYTWSITGGGASPLSEKERAAVGGLPPGLTFNSATATLSGTLAALGDYSFGVQVTDASQHQASKAFSMTSAPSSTAPAVKVSQTTLDFQGPSDGNTPPPQYVSVVAANLEPLSATIDIDSGDTGTPAPPWLTARFVSAITPARLAIFTNQANLRAGAYKGRVLVKYGKVQTLVVNVNFAIDLSPPQLTVAPTYLRFATIAGAAGVSEQALLVTNAGTGGPLDFTASVVSSSPWLTVTPAGGKTLVSGGFPLRVIVNTQGLKVGSYLGKMRVASALGGTVDVPVSLFVSPDGPIISLSTSGVRFDAREGHGLSNTRDVAVLNVGTGIVNWKAELQSGGQGWASLNPAAGQATPNAPGKFTVAADPKLLKAAPYYALVRITDPQALNSPQFLVTVLNVQPVSAAPEPDLSPAGLYFTAVAGGSNPAPQSLTVYGGGDTPTLYQSAASSDDGASWLSIDKTGGSASTQTPGQIQVSVNTANLKAGVYTGDVSVSFSSQTIRTANITLVVLPQGAVLSSTGAEDKQRSAAGCTPSKMSITSTSLVNAFASPAGWPTPISVRVSNDCASAVANAQVVATFSNGDPPLALLLTDSGAAQYSGTWAPGKTASQMTVTVAGIAQGLSAASARLTGTIGPNGAPGLTPNGTVNNLSGTVGAAVAPGTVVQIFGNSLSPATGQPGLIPLPTTFNDSTVLIGAFAAPVYYASGGQINAQIPTELQPDRQYQVLVNSGGAFTLPDTITISQASPGLLNLAQHADFSLITADSPARAGESIILYLVGMGATSPSVASGAGSPAGPPASANLAPSVTIDGSTATVSFAGLTPGLVGLYQINVEVPAGVTPGDVSITVTQNDTESNTVTIPVR
jgi:hypothetical protein